MDFPVQAAVSDIRVEGRLNAIQHPLFALSTNVTACIPVAVSHGKAFDADTDAEVRDVMV